METLRVNVTDSHVVFMLVVAGVQFLEEWEVMKFAQVN